MTVSDQDTGPSATDESYAASVRTTWGHHQCVARLLTGHADQAEGLPQDCLSLDRTLTPEFSGYPTPVEVQRP